MKLKFKNVIKICLYIFLTTIFLTNWQACQNKDESIYLKYKFEKGKNYISDSKFNIKFNINKILLPSVKDSLQAKNNLLPFKNDFFSTDIRSLLTNGNINKLELEITKDKNETVNNSLNNPANITIKSDVKNILLKANGVDYKLEPELTSMLKIFLGGEQHRKRSSNGDWQDLPKILGIDLTEPEGNPYINKLLIYLKKGFSYPDEKVEIGYTWNNDLHVNMPVDSISTGQAQGFISLDIINTRKLEKVDMDVANINLELSVKLSWDVIVPEQGYTKCNLTITGRGYQFFDLKNGWNYGMFFKGNIDLKIDAETIDNVNNDHKIPIIIDATGNIELANKLKG